MISIDDSMAEGMGYSEIAAYLIEIIVIKELSEVTKVWYRMWFKSSRETDDGLRKAPIPLS
jgi:hypothetical protein